jgi:hypothetical protein
MRHPTYALCALVMLAACKSTAAPVPTEETARAQPETEVPEAAEPTVEDSEEPTTAHGLKLAEAREAIAKLTLGLARRHVEQALGEPDRTEFIHADGSLAESAGGGVQWTFEWTLPDGERVRFLIGFRSDASGSPITHFFWLRDRPAS